MATSSSDSQAFRSASVWSSYIKASTDNSVYLDWPALASFCKLAESDKNAKFLLNCFMANTKLTHTFAIERDRKQAKRTTMCGAEGCKKACPWNTMQVCTLCNMVRYCSVACQTRNQLTHVAFCVGTKEFATRLFISDLTNDLDAWHHELQTPKARAVDIAALLAKGTRSDRDASGNPITPEAAAKTTAEAISEEEIANQSQTPILPFVGRDPKTNRVHWLPPMPLIFASATTERNTAALKIEQVDLPKMLQLARPPTRSRDGSMTHAIRMLAYALREGDTDSGLIHQFSIPHGTGKDTQRVLRCAVCMGPTKCPIDLFIKGSMVMPAGVTLNDLFCIAGDVTHIDSEGELTGYVWVTCSPGCMAKYVRPLMACVKFMFGRRNANGSTPLRAQLLYGVGLFEA